MKAKLLQHKNASYGHIGHTWMTSEQRAKWNIILRVDDRIILKRYWSTDES